MVFWCEIDRMTIDWTQFGKEETVPCGSRFHEVSVHGAYPRTRLFRLKFQMKNLFNGGRTSSPNCVPRDHSIRI